MSSITAVVSEGGRIFSIIDEGPTASIYLPARVSLVARDAFNGLLLWKKPIPSWHTHLFRLKSGPQQLARRLVAVDGKVYVTLGESAAVSVLDGATGQIETALKGTEGTSEILEMTIARDRWQQHLKTRGDYYHALARDMESQHAENPDTGAATAALALHALGELLECCRTRRLTRNQHVLFSHLGGISLRGTSRFTPL